METTNRGISDLLLDQKIVKIDEENIQFVLDKIPEVWYNIGSGTDDPNDSYIRQ